MKVHFITPTKLSVLDLCSMGDSSKRTDSSKIGQFDSGLKYAVALLLRADVDIEINVIDNYLTETTFRFGTTLSTDTATGKSKELITISTEEDSLVTGFAKNLGFNWATWMSLREIYSNMLDEGGYYTEEVADVIEKGTVITLEFDQDNEFAEIWQNRHLYINTKEPLFKVSDSVEALENIEGYLRIYKQNILVYEDKDRKSFFAWNIKFGEIDERRILNNVYSIEQDISAAILRTENEEFLRTIITSDFIVNKSDFLGDNYCSWCSMSDTVNKIATEVYQKYGQVSSFGWLIEKIRKRKDCKIGQKKITTIEDAIWSYSKTVTVETTPISVNFKSTEENSVEDTFQDKVNKIYNFKIEADVKTAKLKGSKCVADKFEKCIIVDENFDIEKDFPFFVVEYLDLTQQGNVVENLAKTICNLIKK